MPLFEYRCGDCEQEFEAFVTVNRAAECPVCHGANLEKRLSSPGRVGASNGGRKDLPTAMDGPCGAGGAHCACRTAS